MKIVNRVVMLSGFLGMTLFGGSIAFAAGSGYSPGSTTVPSGTPGGFTQVVTAQTISPTTTTTTNVSATVDGSSTTMAVAPNTFSTSSQVVVTAPSLSQVTSSLSSLGFSGYSAIAGLGVNVVTLSGQPLTSTFLKPITVTVHNASIKPGDKIVEWNAQGTFSTINSATVGNGVASWSFQQDPAFAVIAPTSVVPSATSPVTGKPFLAESLLGAVLLALGTGVLFRSRLKKTT